MSRPYHRWTTSDVKMIQEQYRSLGADVLAERIGTSVQSIYNRASSLGLTDRSQNQKRTVRHYEDAEQAALFQWAANQQLSGADIEPRSHVSDYLFAIPNGGHRQKLEAQRMTTLGVKRGVSDLNLPLARLGYWSLWIEMKRQLTTFQGLLVAAAATSAEQKRWQIRMRKAGHAACTCFGWSEAQQLLTLYLSSSREFNPTYYQLITRFDTDKEAAP